MARNWTESQHSAIEARDGTILVSAAAGSGKTAVLVERAVKRFTEGENPTPADKILVVTFTNSAAAEMRSRLEKALNKMLRKDPQNEQLRRQIIRLSQAVIGTAHGFCADLIREHFHTLEIPPDFKIIVDSQEAEMKAEVLSDVLDAAFESDEFDEIADFFTDERHDRGLANIIETLYTYMQSHPFPEKWLRERVEMFSLEDNAAESPWGKALLKFVCEAAEYMRLLTARALAEAEQDTLVFEAFEGALIADFRMIEGLCEISKAGNWDETLAYLASMKFVRKGSVPKAAQGEAFAKADGLRNDTKKVTKKLVELISSSEEEILVEFSELAKITEKLAKLVASFTERYSERKLEGGFLDYSDLEHYAIKLLANDDGTPTELAREVSLRFDEVMIDEYQDINEVQNTIFHCVSRDGKNLFMVGDVKQSIYGFRCAEPRIFVNTKESLEKYDDKRENYPAYIVLDKNFRSRREVTESVNFVFSQLMNKQTGEIEYGEEEKLVCGADFPESTACSTEMYILEENDDLDKEELEADFIAERIKKMLAEGFMVKDGEDMRPARLSDFAILLRSANRYAHVYAQRMTEQGVLAKANVTEGFFESQEIRLMISFLQVIDNPNQDIPLLAVLMSPIYGFSVDDVTKLRMDKQNLSIYMSLVAAQSLSDTLGERIAEKSRRVISDMEEYRNLSATTPSDTFISTLYGRTGYTDMVLAMENGEVRLANLYLLQSQAKDYESYGYNGIGGFVRFIERVKRNNLKMEAPSLASEADNAVHIMSVHKSKGLEFPVCFIAGCGRGGANRADEVILHPELGLGIKIRDNKIGARYTTMPREAISIDLDKRESAEELRILYVAMTRAKEKLVFVGTSKNAEREIAKSGTKISVDGVIPYAVNKAKNFQELLLMCAMRHPDAKFWRELAGLNESVVLGEHASPWHFECVKEGEIEEAEAQVLAEIEELPKATPNKEVVRAILSKMEFLYPHEELTQIPSKITASKLVAREHGGASESVLSRPSWEGKKAMTPAERGTALHNYMQYADFKNAKENPQAELERLKENGYLTEAEASAVELKKVEAFLGSELGRRVLSADTVEKEKRFTVEVDAAMVFSESYKGGEKIILQGAVDCLFIEGDKLNIIDFKTDNVNSAEELMKSYKTQLKLYAVAMGKVSGLEIGDCYLYSMKTGEAAPLDKAELA